MGLFIGNIFKDVNLWARFSHLPIQNELNILPNKSSEVNCPVISLKAS